MLAIGWVFLLYSLHFTYTLYICYTLYSLHFTEGLLVP